MSNTFQEMFPDTAQAYENLFGETMEETLDRTKSELVYHDGTLYELVPMARGVITEDVYQCVKQERDEWHELYKQATDFRDNWKNRYDELHVRYLNAIHDLEAAKAKAGMYQEQADKLRRRVAQIERKEDDAEKVFHANVRLRKQLNKQAVGVVENA